MFSRSPNERPHLDCSCNVIMNKGHDSGKWAATRLGHEWVICNFAVLRNSLGKWDSPSNNSIVCLLPLWIDFPLIITLLFPAGWQIFLYNKLPAESSQCAIREVSWLPDASQLSRPTPDIEAIHLLMNTQNQTSATVMTGYCVHALTNVITRPGHIKECTQIETLR